MVHNGAAELVDLPISGRTFTNSRRVSIDDATPSGRMELDAIARFLQDVGTDDTDDAGLSELGLAWVARRALIDLLSAPRPRELLTMTTWCSGTGKRWAERRTSMYGDAGGSIEAAAVWVHLDPASGRPIPWGDEFAQSYLEPTGGRRINVKLRHTKTIPRSDATRMVPWSFRATDMDAFGHVNNAAYLAVAEEFLTLEAPCRIEIEWRSPCTADEALVVHCDTVADESNNIDQLWLVGPDDTLRATIISKPSGSDPYHHQT